MSLLEFFTINPFYQLRDKSESVKFRQWVVDNFSELNPHQKSQLKKADHQLYLDLCRLKIDGVETFSIDEFIQHGILYMKESSAVYPYMDRFVELLQDCTDENLLDRVANSEMYSHLTSQKQSIPIVKALCKRDNNFILSCTLPEADKIKIVEELAIAQVHTIPDTALGEAIYKNRARAILSGNFDLMDDRALLCLREHYPDELDNMLHQRVAELNVAQKLLITGFYIETDALYTPVVNIVDNYIEYKPFEEYLFHTYPEKISYLQKFTNKRVAAAHFYNLYLGGSEAAINRLDEDMCIYLIKELNLNTPLIEKQYLQVTTGTGNAHKTFKI